MTDPKASEKEMLVVYEWLCKQARWDSSSARNQEIIQAIRIAIEKDQPKVGVEFIDKWLDRFLDDHNLGEAHAFYLFEEMFREAGVKIVEVPEKGKGGGK